MAKEFTFGITPGFEYLLDEFENQFTLIHIQNMLETAMEYFDKSYFISFKPNILTTLVTDGNDNILQDISLCILQEICIINEESKTAIVIVAMLPREY